MIQNGPSLARSDLPSTHDGAKDKRKRAENRALQQEQLRLLGKIQPFGIYRRMNQDAYESFVAASLVATRDSGFWLAENRPKDKRLKLTMNGDFGLTFLGYQSMRKSLVEAIKGPGLDVVKLVDDLNRIESADLEVPFSHLEWGGNDRRRLLARYTLDTTARQLLDDQRRQIDEVLEYHHIERTPLEPDHTSVIRYAPARLPYSQESELKTLSRRKRRARPHDESRELSGEERRHIAKIFEDKYISKGIGSIVLGPLVLGTSYSRPVAKPDLGVRVAFSNDLE